jgi:hypothetical protein
MVPPVHNIDPKILPGESAKLRWVGREAGDLIFQLLWSNGKKKALDVGGPGSIDFIAERLYCKRPVQCLASSKILTPHSLTARRVCTPRRSNKKQRSCNGRGGAQRPVWGSNELKKTGARSARARTRGQNPLVLDKEREISRKLSERYANSAGNV